MIIAMNVKEMFSSEYFDIQKEDRIMKRNKNKSFDKLHQASGTFKDLERCKAHTFRTKKVRRPNNKRNLDWE